MRLRGLRKGIKPSAMAFFSFFPSPPCLVGMVSLEFNGLGAGEIKRRPEVEVLPATKDNRTEVTKKVLTWLTEAVN
jgi:hypothetical protein